MDYETYQAVAELAAHNQDKITVNTLKTLVIELGGDPLDFGAIIEYVADQ